MKITVTADGASFTASVPRRCPLCYPNARPFTATGNTVAEAIGTLVREHANDFGITIDAPKEKQTRRRPLSVTTIMEAGGVQPPETTR